MKKIALIGLTFLVALLLSFSAQAKPVVNAGLYCTEALDDDADGIVDGDGYPCIGNFTTKFWKEKFLGGGPGQPGNVLMAIGQGFTLQNLALVGVEEMCLDQPCQIPEGSLCFPGEYNFKTQYSGGFLRLNKGPHKPREEQWLRKGKLKATDLEATNYTYYDQEGNLHFCLEMTGQFQTAPKGQDYWYKVMATFDGTPENYQFKYDDEGNPVFHRGYDFGAMIEISDTAPPVAP